MAGDDGADETVSIRTYVPRYQKERWQEHADELGMSQSEFIRTMVQAGRKGFEPPESAATPERVNEPNREEPDSSAVTPGVDGLKRRVEQVLADGNHYDWDELLAALTDDIEERLDETMQELQSAGRVRYSGRHGGYVLAE
ncbi:DUF5805 domain-containing protein [Haloarcula marina]|uniref:DUF5805 domain-containing protein n=1 Tax=Haloarcula marina TaxID=2961574 RepID=UPI0020B7C57E|nr:DUF5805 domain-containing protein [Halomicroarcula marina]